MNSPEQIKKVPRIRFPDFNDSWKSFAIKQLLTRASNSVNVNMNEEYRQIGIRSHGKGIFHKEAVSGTALGNKRVFWVEEDAFIVNIVFAWEQAVAKTTRLEKGMVASHRFPMYLPKHGLTNTDFILEMFLTKKGKYLLGLASPGGAGRNKTLGQKTFEELKLVVPTAEEQEKIASFLSVVDKRIERLDEKKRLLTEYKKGVMKQIFAQHIRFKDSKGNSYPNWEEKRLGDVCECLDNKRVPLNRTQRSMMKGNIPYWGANNIMDYVNDYIFDEPLILLAEDGGYFDEFQTRPIANISYGKCWVNNHAHILRAKKSILTEYAYLSLVHKNILGYVNTGTRAKLNKGDMLKIPLWVPSIMEQRKIADFSMTIGYKIEHVTSQLELAKTFKKGLLQQMFV